MESRRLRLRAPRNIALIALSLAASTLARPQRHAVEDAAPQITARAVQVISDGQVQEISDGQVQVISDGQVQVISDAQVSVVSNGYVNEASDGQVQVISDGQVQVISDGQVQVTYESQSSYAVYTTTVSETAGGVATASVVTMTSSVTNAAAGAAASSSAAAASSYSTAEAASSSAAAVAASYASQNPSAASAASVASSVVASQASSSVPDVSLTSLTTSEVQSATVSTSVAADTTGTVVTTLETAGNPTSAPVLSSVATSTTGTLSLIDASTVSSFGPTATSSVTTIVASNIFVAMETNAPPSQITSRTDHPVPTTNIVSPNAYITKRSIRKRQSTTEQRPGTNKFYANFFLPGQSAPIYTYPYSVQWSLGTGETSSYGMAISHTERSQLSEGPAEAETGAWEYFVNPVGIQSIVLSATQLTNGTTMTVDTLEGFSGNANLLAPGASEPAIVFPFVQGQAFITAVYNNATPTVQSGLGIISVTYAGAVSTAGGYKYSIDLNDGYTWLVYVQPSTANYTVNAFTLLDTNVLQGPSNFQGTIQVAKIPANTSNAEAIYDSSAGAYPTNNTISGSVDGTTGSYTFSFGKGGSQIPSLLMFALPHHVASLSGANVTDLQLVSPAKGYMTAIVGDSWTLAEPDLPIDMNFAPYKIGTGPVTNVSDSATELINEAATLELAEDVAAQTDLNSMYYSGKALAKFAAIVYAANDIAGNASLALTGLVELQSAFATFVNNTQIYPLVYDTVWGGAVSSSTYDDGSSGDDFGNTYYNDHHFHYGYFVYAAAVIGYLEPAWLEDGTNAAWVNMLVRDYANPVGTDPYFPFSRMFDWFHGHSWAGGLFAESDGKNQESSSEDTMSAFAIKMWGQVTGDTNMEARGNLQLAIQRRALSDYYLYQSDNTVEPSGFIGNKAGGIVFENKIDHTTYFGTNVEYIEGIHMLPLLPHSTYTRQAAFVTQEWETYFAADDYVDTVDGGWRGILYANLAIINATGSYDWISNATGQYNSEYLDGGASRTWYLAFAAALGGSPASNTTYTKRDVLHGPAAIAAAKEVTMQSKQTKAYARSGDKVSMDNSAKAVHNRHVRKSL